METLFRQSFLRDIKKVRSKVLRQQLQAVVESVEQASDVREIAELKRLTGEGPYYRIRVGDYRIGVTIDDHTVTFIRFLHRRDIYRYYP